VAISVLRIGPREAAESARLAAADALNARLAAEEKAERAKLAAEKALQAQRAAEEAAERARLAAEQAEKARQADEDAAERAKGAAEEALETWRATLVAEKPRTLRMLPPFPETELRAAGLELNDTSEVEGHDAERPATDQPDLPALEEQAETVTCQIAFWRGYRKGAFYARALDEDGFEVALAESPLFKPQGNGGVPDDTDEAVAAHEALVAQLANDGWVATGCDDNWFGRTFRRPLPS
jgi:hypothetical protein